MNGKAKKWLSLAVQLLIIAGTAWAVGHMFLFSGSGNMRENKIAIFRYFTVDSNILCMVSCVFSLVHRSKGIMLLRYAATSAVTVTLMTVLLFLGPLYGYAAMFANWNLWLHLLGPVLAILSFVWLERDGTCPGKKHLILSVLPVLLYGAVYFILVVVIGREKGGWPDFYMFNRGGKWYISFAAMGAGTALIGAALRKLRAVSRKKAERNLSD